jgi:hypothetical protein
MSLLPLGQNELLVQNFVWHLVLQALLVAEQA